MQTLDPSMRVGVVRGGFEPGHIHSLKHGAAFIKESAKLFDSVSDIFVSPYGAWFWKGKEVRPEIPLFSLDVVWDCTHNLPGSTVHETLVLHNKNPIGAHHTFRRQASRWSSLRKFFEARGFARRKYFVVEPDSLYDAIPHIFSSATVPFVVKSNFVSSNIPGKIVWDTLELATALEDVIDENGEAYVEEYQDGARATVFVLNNFRASDVYVFPPVFSDAVPRPLSKEIEKQARDIHQTLDMSPFSEITFNVLHDNSIIFENIQPHISWGDQDFIQQSFSPVGVTHPEVVTHLHAVALE